MYSARGLNNNDTSNVLSCWKSDYFYFNDSTIT